MAGTKHALLRDDKAIINMITKEAEEAIKAEIDRLELANRRQIVKQWSYGLLIRKLESDIYAEEVRRKAFQVLRKRLESGDIGDDTLFRMIAALGKVSETVFLEIYKSAFP